MKVKKRNLWVAAEFPATARGAMASCFADNKRIALFRLAKVLGVEKLHDANVHKTYPSVTDGTKNYLLLRGEQAVRVVGGIIKQLATQN